MSQRYVALLRAINVGGRVVKMDQLRAIFEALRLHEVKTVITSGNVVFTSGRQPEALESSIERRLKEALGYPVVTFVRTIEEMGVIAAREPFGQAPEGTHHVAFLKKAPDAASARSLVACSNEVDRFRVQGREAHWLISGGFSASTFSGAKLEKLVGPATARNINTVRKLAAHP
jgi:uncharacterized protein (DUF1697 family)